MTKYKSRLTCPEKTNKYYTNGEYNPFAYNYDMFKLGGNCTTYAYGRMAELIDRQPVELSTRNAENWYIDTKFKKGNTPKLGAVICWSKGKKNYGKDGAGHVAVVEQINTDESIVISESGYKSFLFRTSTVKKPYSKSGYQLEGFIYCPIEFEEEVKPTKVDVEYQVYDNDRKEWLGVIKNYNETNSNGYAGWTGHDIGGLRARLTDGSKITIKSHVLGGSWLGDITKWNNTNNGYSGIKGKRLDKVMIKCDKYKIKYRVYAKGKGWLGWITDFDPNKSNGYAGWTGYEIQKIQIGLID